MNRKQLKEATDAFVDELVTTEYAYTIYLNKQSFHSIRIGGRIVDMYPSEAVEGYARKLKDNVAKIYRKHIKQLLSK